MTRRVRVKKPTEESPIDIEESSKDTEVKDEGPTNVNEKENDEQNTNISSMRLVWYTIGMVVIIIGSMLAISYYFNKNPETNPNLYTYNGFEFEKIGNYWYTDIKVSHNANILFNLEMRYDPQSVEDIDVDIDVFQRFIETKGFWLTADPDLTGKTAIAMMEVNRVVSDTNNILNYPTEAGITDFLTEHDPSLSVIDCENATRDFKVIWFGLANTTEITFMDNCFMIQGTNQSEIIRASDRFLYELMRVMKS